MFGKLSLIALHPVMSTELGENEKQIFPFIQCALLFNFYNFSHIHIKKALPQIAERPVL